MCVYVCVFVPLLLKKVLVDFDAVFFIELLETTKVTLALKIF